ncbi:response regulator [Bosea sp. PAMC 26642]|uniref:response regulator n=1 Tax=Bosea sp. (strain PAMC 26642) TaxID=1792307 RepID=UPI00077048BA|nr:response regulator [Bosea sp. PAMC 26642]AMJ61061.1 transcriptional regulator [Bosea sp. PAMC 26642]
MTSIALLLVEDETLIALDLEDALTHAGFECVVTSSGQKALDELEKDASRFKGVLTDIRLGQGPSGWDVGQRARELVAEMPLVYMSGDSSGEWASKGVPNSLMIQKPYALTQVITAISQLITAAGMSKAGAPPA